MTGHQVFSTLHTNSAVGAIPRLLDTGIPPDIMSGNIIGVMGQRLVRKLCVHCKEPYDPPRMVQEEPLGFGMRTIFRRSIVQSDAIIVIIPATKADLPSPRCSSSTVKSMSSSHAAPQSGKLPIAKKARDS